MNNILPWTNPMTERLAPYAVTEPAGKGRTFAEAPHPYRSAFERDRDRIIHCSAFRRLEGKTQVFTPGLDDYYRTRLTHTIEVAQIGRTIARALGLNEALTEAICLAHDLGHPPFGHAGEAALNALMSNHGGFEHNAQTLRIVTLLEHPYPAFMGLNLMYETRLGLAKHKSRYDVPQDNDFAEANGTLEGQIADLADRIAYDCHDLEDGMKARLLESDQMEHIEIFAEARRRIAVETIEDWTIRRTRTAKAIIDVLVSDCIDVSRQAIAAARLQTPRDACDRPDNLIRLSPEYDRKLEILETFLLERFYHHESLLRNAEQASRYLAELFEKLCAKPEIMPSYFRRFIDPHGLQRAVCDYIAGMTDRFALQLTHQP